MKMEPLPGGCLKIWMTPTDLQRWGLTPAAIDAHNPATRRTIVKLLKIAEQRYGFRRDSKLTVEIVSLGSGCLLLLTPGNRSLPSGSLSPTIYTVHNANDLLRLGKSLSDAFPTSLPTASLFAWKREYRLILYTDVPLNVSFHRVLSEFADPVADSAVVAAYTEEHGHALAIGNALQQLLTVRGFPEPTPPDPAH